MTFPFVHIGVQQWYRAEAEVKKAIQNIRAVRLSSTSKYMCINTLWMTLNPTFKRDINPLGKVGSLPFTPHTFPRTRLDKYTTVLRHIWSSLGSNSTSRACSQRPHVAFPLHNIYYCMHHKCLVSPESVCPQVVTLGMLHVPLRNRRGRRSTDSDEASMIMWP